MLNIFQRIRRNIIPLFCARVQYFRFIEYMYEIGTTKIFISEYTEDKVNQRCGGFDIWMFYKPGWIKTGKCEFVNELLQWNAILQTN